MGYVRVMGLIKFCAIERGFLFAQVSPEWKVCQCSIETSLGMRDSTVVKPFEMRYVPFH